MDSNVTKKQTKNVADLKNCIFLSFDLDLTGRRLLDEMMNVGIYGTDVNFKQYVIPHRSVTLNSKRRHCLQTANLFEFRVLRDTTTGKIVKTKTEIFALFDILNLLEAKNASANNPGIVLMCFEETYRLIPYILIEALRRYELLDRFKKVVVGIANCYEFVKEKCSTSIPKFSLKTLAKILLSRDSDRIHDAHERSKLVFEIATHLSEGETLNKLQDLAVGMSPFVHTVEEIENDLESMKLGLSKQNNLKPIFGDLIRNPLHRKRAILLRKYLTAADINYSVLKSVAQAKGDWGEFLKSRISSPLPEKDLTDLSKFISIHFQKISTDNKSKQERPAKNTVSQPKNETANNDTEPKEIKAQSVSEQESVSVLEKPMSVLSVSCETQDTESASKQGSVPTIANQQHTPNGNLDSNQ